MGNLTSPKSRKIPQVQAIKSWTSAKVIEFLGVNAGLTSAFLECVPLTDSPNPKWIPSVNGGESGISLSVFPERYRDVILVSREVEQVVARNGKLANIFLAHASGRFRAIFYGL
jgi:hypothetical protein